MNKKGKLFEEFLERIGAFELKNRSKIHLTMKDIINEMDDAVVIWGASTAGRKIMETLIKSNKKVKFFVDSDKNKWGRHICGIKVKSPNRLKNDDFVVIGSMF